MADQKTESVSKEVEVIRIGKDEMNIIEFPLTLLSDRPDPNTSEVRYTFPTMGKGGAVTESTVTVTGSEKYGLPLAGDMDIYLILLELTKEQGFQSRTVYFSRYEIIQRLFAPGKKSGSHYERIKNALNRLVGVTVYADRWYDKNTKRYHAVGFHLLERISIADEAPGRKPALQPHLRYSSITWDETIFKSFQAGYIKNLDLAKYFELSSPIARQLYRFLDKRFYDGKPKYEIGIRLLAHEHLGISRSYEYESTIKKKMKKAHDELIAQGILEKVDFRQGREGLVVVYTPKRKAALPTPPVERIEIPAVVEAPPEPTARPADPSPPTEECSGGETGTVQLLRQAGVSESVIEQIVNDHPEERILEKLAFLSHAKPKNPAGWLRRAIEEDWSPPAGYLRAQRQRKPKVESVEVEVPPPSGPSIEDRLAGLPADEQEALRAAAEAAAREKHPKAADLFDRGRGKAAWKKLVDGEISRLLPGDSG